MPKGIYKRNIEILRKNIKKQQYLGWNTIRFDKNKLHELKREVLG